VGRFILREHAKRQRRARTEGAGRLPDRRRGDSARDDSPDAEVYGAPGIINAGTYHGYEGFQQWVRQWEEAWDEINYELGDMIEVGNAFVVVPAHIVGRGAGSGLEIDSVFGWMYEFQDGKAVRFHTYATVDDALEAARRLSGSE